MSGFQPHLQTYKSRAPIRNLIRAKPTLHGQTHLGSAYSNYELQPSLFNFRMQELRNALPAARHDLSITIIDT